MLFNNFEDVRKAVLNIYMKANIKIEAIFKEDNKYTNVLNLLLNSLLE